MNLKIKSEYYSLLKDIVTELEVQKSAISSENTYMDEKTESFKEKAIKFLIKDLECLEVSETEEEYAEE